MLSPMDSTVNSSGVSSGAGTSVDYRKKRIKNVQKLELVRLMKANFLFIRGKHAVARCEKSRADVWKMITARLNNLGPPVQSAEAWQRRWNDMRSATKSKMAKIQNYVREQGEDCPYKLNLVERLIWDTFSVKPEEYMKDLNMKLWREKRHQDHVRLGQHSSNPVPVPTDSESVSSADASLDLGFDAMGRSDQLQTTTHEGAPSSSWQGPSVQSCELADPGRSEDQMMVANQASYYSQFPSTAGFGSYSTVGGSYTGASVSRGRSLEEQWQSSGGMSSGDRGDANVCQQKNPFVPPEKLPGGQVLRDLNKMLDQILRQNEEILYLLRQPTGDH